MSSSQNSKRTCADCLDDSHREEGCARFRLSEALLGAVFERAVDGILLTEPTGRILGANPAASRILRRPRSELRQLTRTDLVKPDDERLPRLLVQREQAGFYQGELTLVRGDGSYVEAEVTSVAVDHVDGGITTMIIRDISDRKMAESRVEEQAKWLDKASEAILVTDLDHRITYWNQGAERMVGWTAMDVLGRRMTELLSLIGVTDSQVFDAADRVVDWWGTLRCRHRDGATVILASSATVLRNAEGLPTGRLCICTDITEQTVLREKYERAQRLQSIGMLAAGVAHDVNNILTPIRLAVPLLRPQLQQVEDVQLLDTIETCVARGAGVVRQILGFSQGTGNEARAIDLRVVVREVAEIVRETFPRSIAVVQDNAAELWPVLANPTQMHQLLLNLCVNARDAMRNGGRLRFGARNCVLDEETAAHIEGGRAGSHVVLVVEDTGTGIPPEMLAQVWEPFFTTKPAEVGTGLGLATVRSIVESHAGFIALESTPGRGSTFRVFLPAASTPLPVRQVDAPIVASGGGGETILVVDDEPVVREVTRSVLARAGYRVVVAAHGAVALAMVQAREEPFDLVLTDIDMPELDGVGLARALTTLRPNLPVMAMSGLNSGASRADQTCFSAGFLPKPFAAQGLLGAVREALRYRNG